MNKIIPYWLLRYFSGLSVFIFRYTDIGHIVCFPLLMALDLGEAEKYYKYQGLIKTIKRYFTYNKVLHSKFTKGKDIENWIPEPTFPTESGMYYFSDVNLTLSDTVKQGELVLNVRTLYNSLGYKTNYIVNGDTIETFDGTSVAYIINNKQFII